MQKMFLFIWVNPGFMLYEMNDSEIEWFTDTKIAFILWTN